MKEFEHIHFNNRESFRKWLEKNHNNSIGIWMIFYKKHSNSECIEYNEALEEALCFGWIDSIIKKMDNDSYVRKFTPRTNISKWSELNKTLVLSLIEKGKMTEAGLKKIDVYVKTGKVDWESKESNSKEEKNETHIPDSILKAFAENEPALTNFNNLARTYKKRIIRLLISDITVTRDNDRKNLMLNLRWQTGQTQQLSVGLPPGAPDKTRYPGEMVDRVRELTLRHGDDNKTVETLNSQGILSATGKPFTKDMIEWIRYKHRIDKPLIRAEHEFTVPEVRKMFSVSRHMVYYWVSRKYVQIRRTPKCILIRITPDKQLELRQIIDNSYKANCRLGTA